MGIGVGWVSLGASNSFLHPCSEDINCLNEGRTHHFWFLPTCKDCPPFHTECPRCGSVLVSASIAYFLSWHLSDINSQCAIVTPQGFFKAEFRGSLIWPYFRPKTKGFHIPSLEVYSWQDWWGSETLFRSSSRKLPIFFFTFTED